MKIEPKYREHYLDYYDEEPIKNILMFRKIIKVEGDTLFLDNGTALEIIPNEGCGGCSSGWYDIEELNTCDNVITDVQLSCDDLPGYEKAYSIFVYAENKEIKAVEVTGSDGNGYYGTGYRIRVKEKNAEKPLGNDTKIEPLSTTEANKLNDKTNQMEENTMKVKKFKKVIDDIAEVIANPDMEQFGIDEETASKYLSVLETAKDIAKENKKLKKELEGFKNQVGESIEESGDDYER